MSPSLSVRQGAQALGLPVLVTTVDHALLRPEWVQRFRRRHSSGRRRRGPVGFEAAVRAAAPDTIRSYMKFRDGRYSGCNLFYLRNERSLAVDGLLETGGGSSQAAVEDRAMRPRPC